MLHHYHKLERQWILQKKRELLSPDPLDSLDELEGEVEQRPRYVGPGPWIEVVREENPNPEGD